MIFRDPPAHTRLRAPVKAAFTPRAVAALEPEIQRIVDEVLDSFGDDPIDLREQFAGRIPALVIAAVLGVPHAGPGTVPGLVSRPRPHRLFDGAKDHPTPAVERSADGFSSFFGDLIERERRSPSGSILSAIANLETSDLDRMELVGACTLLLFAGHETTATLLNTFCGLLLEHPELMDWMRAHPEADATAIDEVLRMQGRPAPWCVKWPWRTSAAGSF